MKARHFYLVTLFFRELFANRISAFFAMDVIVSAIVLIWFIQSEGKRLRVGFFGYQRLERWSSVSRLGSRFFFF